MKFKCGVEGGSTVSTVSRFFVLGAQCVSGLRVCPASFVGRLWLQWQDRNFHKFSKEQKKIEGQRLLQTLVDLLRDEQAFKPRVGALGGNFVHVHKLKKTMERQRSWLVAGSVCKDWSSIGAQQGLLGQYVVPLACLLGLTNFLSPSVS